MAKGPSTLKRRNFLNMTEGNHRNLDPIRRLLPFLFNIILDGLARELREIKQANNEQTSKQKHKRLYRKGEGRRL